MSDASDFRPCQDWVMLFTLLCSSSLSCMNDYMAVDNGGYLYMNSLRALNFSAVGEVETVFG